MYNTAIWTTIELQTLKVSINTCERAINTFKIVIPLQEKTGIQVQHKLLC